MKKIICIAAVFLISISVAMAVSPNGMNDTKMKSTYTYTPQMGGMGMVVPTYD